MSATGAARLRKIGEIADATGMTIRALHYYEEVGLLAPTARTDAGHRLYGPDAVERLYRISLLRQLGVPLDGIRTSLADDGAGLRSLMTEHLTTIDARLAAEHRLRGRLVALVGTLETDEDTTGDLLNILEEMTMLETTVDRRIAILRVRATSTAAFDVPSSASYGLGPGELMRDPRRRTSSTPRSRRATASSWLHTESEARSPLRSPKHLGGASGTMAVMVDDVDAAPSPRRRSAAPPSGTLPVDQDYGYREYSAIDPDGPPLVVHEAAWRRPRRRDASPSVHGQ